MSMDWEPSVFGGGLFGGIRQPAEVPLQCNFCSFLSESSLEYQNHTLTHISSTPEAAGGGTMNEGVGKKPKLGKLAKKSHPCGSCSAVCISAAALKKHRKEKHPQLSSPMKRPRTKAAARMGHFNDLKKPKMKKTTKETFEPSKFNQLFLFKCHQCEYSASSKMDVDSHELIHDAPGCSEKGYQIDDKKSYKCPFNCGYSGARDYLLKAHLERQHGLSTGKSTKPKAEKPSKAPLKLPVPAKTTKITTIQVDKQVKPLSLPQKMEEMIFQCGMCEYAGSKKENLKRHMQRVHGATGVKPKKKGEGKNMGATVVTLPGGKGLAAQLKVGPKTKKK